MRMDVHTKDKTYPIIIERGILSRVNEYVDKERFIFIVSDDGVPSTYQECLLNQFPNSHLKIVKHGEAAKSYEVLRSIHEEMLEVNMSRKDLVVALGGGVIGDLAGFAAATYMRGIEYINIPTTTLSQIDSSIGGKTAIDLGEYKNCVGAFWQPSLVLVDLDTLKTLDERNFNNGLAEAVKAGLIKDERIFELFEEDNYLNNLEEIIIRSLEMKKDVVEKDERESGERKLLNFGHTYGHAYESYYALEEYLHGECVAMGMMTILNNQDIKERLKKVLKKLNLPISCEADKEKVCELIKNDKKADHDKITIVQVDKIGEGHLEEWSMSEIRRKLYE